MTGGEFGEASTHKAASLFLTTSSLESVFQTYAHVRLLSLLTFSIIIRADVGKSESSC